MLTLPQDKSWADYDYLSVFCHRARQDFAHVRIPRDQLTIPVARGSGAYQVATSSAAVVVAAIAFVFLRVQNAEI